MLSLTVILIAVVVGALHRRAHGGLTAKAPAVALGALLSIVIAAAPALLAGAHPLAAWPALIPATLVMLGWAMGHGSYMDMGRMPRPDNESVRVLVRPFARLAGYRDMSLGYDVIGMSLRYGIFTVATGAAVSLLGLGWGLLLAPAGFLAGPIYWLCWELVPQDRHPTEPGEWALGAVIWGAYAASFWAPLM